MTGLENNRANLLLGLIIRQRPKRDFLPVDMNETARIIPETKPTAVSTKETRATEEDDKSFLSSLTAAQHKDSEKQINTTEDTDEPITESFEEPRASETNNQEPQKPLRFLPGVLVGWGGELPPLPDVGGKPATAADDTQKTQPAPKTEASTGNTKNSTAAASRERFVIKKKEAKPVKAEQEPPSPNDTSVANNSSEKDAAVVTHSASVSLKDKPPDVSTEAFLESLSTAPSRTETSSTASANKGNAGPLSETEKGTSEGSSLSQSKSQAASAHTNSSKPPLSGILKKSSAYSNVNEDKTTVLQKDTGSRPAPLSPKPVPVLSSPRNDAVTPFHQGFLQISQAKNQLEEENKTTVRSCTSEKEDPVMSQACASVTRTVQGPQTTCYTESSEPQNNSVLDPALPVYNSAAPIPSQQQQPQPQVPGSYDYLTGPHTQDQNHSTQWAQDGNLHTLPGLSQLAESYSEQAGKPPPLAKDYKHVEERHSDSWERPQNTEDRDQHGRHSHHKDPHHGKKSRHHDREREKKHDRTHDEKYRERSRHHGHSDDRYVEKRKERQHSDDYSSRHKDRHRHRRDSDYENGRRSSRDSYS